MNEILTFISSNPTILIILLGLFIAVVIILVVTFVDAYRKGRPLSLWLFKIEARPKETGGKAGGKERKIDTQHEIVELANRSGFQKTFMERLEKAQLVYLMGINLDGIVAQYQAFITAKAREGCHFKMLMVDHQFFDMMGGIAFASWPGGIRSQRDLGHAINTLDDIYSILKASANENNIELGFISLPPPYTMLAVNPDSPEGDIQIELYTYEHDTHERPHFILTRNETPRWYEFFQKEFIKAWAKARPYKPLLGTKPIREKAGTVIYRQSADGGHEFLVITARLKPQTWIFPVGSVEQGESLQQAAVREGSEESGYIGNIEMILGSIQVDRGEVIDQITFFLTKLVGEQPSREFDRQRKWVEMDILEDIILSDFRPIVQAVKTCLKL